MSTYYVVALAEASSNLAQYDGVRYSPCNISKGTGLQNVYAIATRGDGFGDNMKRQIMIGTYVFVLSARLYGAYHTQAQKVRSLIACSFKLAWTLFDLLLSLIVSSTAFKLGDFGKKLDNTILAYLNEGFIMPSSLAELLTMSALGRLDHQSLSLGSQSIGHLLDEQGMLNTNLPIKECAGFVARADCW